MMFMFTLSELQYFEQVDSNYIWWWFDIIPQIPHKPESTNTNYRSEKSAIHTTIHGKGPVAQIFEKKKNRR